jgi:two-component system nitrogen regulation response regulator NtrX
VKILIVDDDDATVRALERALRPLGHDLFLCGTVKDARAFLQSDPPDLILLDIELHGTMGGFDVAREAPRKIPLVVISGHAQVELVRIARTDALHGVSLFLSKPLDLKQLLAIVAHIARP